MRQWERPFDPACRAVAWPCPSLSRRKGRRDRLGHLGKVKVKVKGKGKVQVKVQVKVKVQVEVQVQV